MKKPDVRSRSGRIWRKRWSRRERSPRCSSPSGSTATPEARPGSAPATASFSARGDRAGRVDHRPAGRQRAGGAGQQPALQQRQPLDQLRRLPPAGVGARGERSEVGARRIHEDPIVARAEVGLGGVGDDDAHVRDPGPLAELLDLGGALRVDLDARHLAAGSDPLGELGRLDPRARRRGRGRARPGRGSSSATTACDPRDCGTRSPVSTRALTACPALRDDERRVRVEQAAAARAAHLDPGLAQRCRHPLRVAGAKRGLRRLVHRPQQRAGAGGAELVPEHPRQPVGIGERDGGAERRRVVEAAEQRLALGRGAAKDRVHEAGGGPRLRRRAAVATHPRLRELDRLIDGGVVRGRVREADLEQAEPQRGECPGVDRAGAAAGQPGEQGVARPAPLDGAVGEPPALRELAAAELVARSGRAERAVGPRVVLERPPDHLVRGPPRRRDPDSLGAHSSGSGRPRR